MTRLQLEHVIRAASAISDDREIVVVGSQAILGQFPDAPPEMLASNEADVWPRNHPERSDLIDGGIGELSMFHETFGYYAQGVGPETAVLPSGWELRVVPVHSRDATGLCLEAHDLVISKYLAGREKDRAYVRAAIRHGLVKGETLLERLASTSTHPVLRDRVKAFIAADVAALGAP